MARTIKEAPVVGGGNSIPPEHRAEYQERTRRKTEVPVIGEANARYKEGLKGPVAHADRTRRADPKTGEIFERPSSYRMLAGDDWVQKLTQPQRDDILNHPAIKTAKRG